MPTWWRPPFGDEVPPNEIDNILDNIGLPFSPYNLMHSTSGVLGANDADVLVSLRKNHRPTAEYVRALRQKLPREFPGTTFYFSTRGYRDPDSQFRSALTY